MNLFSSFPFPTSNAISLSWLSPIFKFSEFPPYPSPAHLLIAIFSYNDQQYISQQDGTGNMLCNPYAFENSEYHPQDLYLFSDSGRVGDARWPVPNDASPNFCCHGDNGYGGQLPLRELTSIQSQPAYVLETDNIDTETGRLDLEYSGYMGNHTEYFIHQDQNHSHHQRSIVQSSEPDIPQSNTGRAKPAMGMPVQVKFPTPSEMLLQPSPSPQSSSSPSSSASPPSSEEKRPETGRIARRRAMAANVGFIPTDP